MKKFVLLAFCMLTTILDAIDKKYICSIWLWYSQWFNLAFVYEEIWMCNYAQLHDRCNLVPICSQTKEVNQALMISSCLVLFEVTLSIQTFTDTSPGSLVINMPIVVWYNDLVSTSLSYDFKDDFSDLFIYCVKLRQWLSKARYICWSTSSSSWLSKKGRSDRRSWMIQASFLSVSFEWYWCTVSDIVWYIAFIYLTILYWELDVCIRS